MSSLVFSEFPPTGESWVKELKINKPGLFGPDSTIVEEIRIICHSLLRL
jgi:hypothetical protein